MKNMMLLILAIAASIYRSAIDAIRSVVNAPGFAPVRRIMRSVSAQVDSVASIFPKMPCSATGGTA